MEAKLSLGYLTDYALSFSGPGMQACKIGGRFCQFRLEAIRKTGFRVCRFVSHRRFLSFGNRVEGLIDLLLYFLNWTIIGLELFQ